MCGCSLSCPTSCPCECHETQRRLDAKHPPAPPASETATAPAPSERCACGHYGAGTHSLNGDCTVCPYPESLHAYGHTIAPAPAPAPSETCATNFEPWTLCAQCGPRADVDEDGCCTSCGSDALQNWGPDPTLALRAACAAKDREIERHVAMHEALARKRDAAEAERERLRGALEEIAVPLVKHDGKCFDAAHIAAAAIKETP
jgi:hypothetical protein